MIYTGRRKEKRKIYDNYDTGKMGIVIVQIWKSGIIVWRN